MQYQVTRKCGHEETVDLRGKMDKREWRLANVEPDKLCSECWATQQAAEAEVAAENAAENGLPELEGSEKQINWAETIRADAIEQIDKCLDEFENKCEKKFGDEITAESMSIYRGICDRIATNADAGWWIDNRDRSPKLWIRDESTGDERVELKRISNNS